MNVETWKDVPEWVGFYQVSDHGRVRSVTRTLMMLDPKGRYRSRTFTGRIIKPARSTPYDMVSLTAPDRKRWCVTSNVLVLLAFYGPPGDGQECCHNDGNPRNNVLGNLRWDTRSANAMDRHKHGTVVRVCGEDSASAKLTNEQVLWIRANSHLSQRAMGRTLGVSHGTVARVLRGESWGHV